MRAVADLQICCLLCKAQGINRCATTARDELQCYHPGGRMFLRRRARWMTCVEMYAGHGYSLSTVSRNYSHRELSDLLGNSFASSSVMVSSIALFSMTTLVSWLQGHCPVQLSNSHSHEHPEWSQCLAQGRGEQQENVVQEEDCEFALASCW